MNLDLELELTDLQAPDRAALAGRGEAPGNQVEGRAEMTLTGPAEGTGPGGAATARPDRFPGLLPGDGAGAAGAVAHAARFRVERRFNAVRDVLDSLRVGGAAAVGQGLGVGLQAAALPVGPALPPELRAMTSAPRDAAHDGGR